MNVRFALCLLPVLAGWILAVRFHHQALAHLRTPLPERWPAVRVLLTILLTPRNSALYTLEGIRYRGYSLSSVVAGAVVTTLLFLMLRPSP
jgi:hypothetical protein